MESAGGEGLRTSFWNGYDLTTRRGRERLHQLCSEKKPRLVWFSSPCRVSGVSSQRVSRILDGIASVVPRVQALGCHVHFAQPLSASSWKQNSLVSMSEKMMKAVVNGCAWSLRDSQGSLLNRSWQVLTTSPDVQRVLNHRICDKKHKHGRLFGLSSESSLQFPKSLYQTLAKQFLVKDSWHSVLGLLEHLHLDEDERPFNPSASSHETPMEVDVLPPVLPPSALPPPAPLVDAGPNSSERKEITKWLQKIHQQIGRRDVRLLKQRGTHPCVLKMATEHRCSACEESRPPRTKTFLEFWRLPACTGNIQ